MPKAPRFFDLYVLQGLAKGFSIFYFVLLPVFYAQHFISTKLLGNIGAFSIAMVILGAVAVTRWLHRLSTKRLLELSASGTILASCLLLLAVRAQSVWALSAAYGLIGLAGGMAISGINAVVAARTEKGQRFGAIARLSMLVDVVRIVFPLIVSGALLWANVTAAVVLVLISAIIFAIFVARLPKTVAVSKGAPRVKPISAFYNKGFRFIMSLEFLDSFSSSQLFVFLPLLFLAKGHSLESSLVLQTAIFLGYFCGRWFEGQLARRYSGLRAVAWAEIGMFVAIGTLFS